MVYTIQRTPHAPALEAPWDAPVWADAKPLRLAHFRPEGSDHRPAVEARLLWGDGSLFGVFRVNDRFVRSVQVRYGDPVCRDSCVELFVEPAGGQGYVNFEWNAGGTLLASHVTDPTRTPTGLAAATPLPVEQSARVRARSSLPRVVDPEVRAPLTWTLAFEIPFPVLQAVTGAPSPAPGDLWRANLYKCADETSHPHWASWAPVDDRNFHLPRCFGALRFA
ncbi:MAG: carbohydrate-binding family 9-like protein [Deltaproteobacteria bacterium]|nr:carbohydrate-binding family 9-like protein [Deltaproteobacteria bacterium]